LTFTSATFHAKATTTMVARSPNAKPDRQKAAALAAAAALNPALLRETLKKVGANWIRYSIQFKRFSFAGKLTCSVGGFGWELGMRRLTDAWHGCRSCSTR
jgi:hypothetical protein